MALQLHPARLGGDKLACWTTETVRDRLDHLPCEAFGYVLIPQLGERAGEPVSRYELKGDHSQTALIGHQKKEGNSPDEGIRGIVTNEINFNLDERIVDETTTKSQETANGHYTVVRTPIVEGFDVPIGYLCAVSQYQSDSLDLVSALSQAAQYISTRILTERSVACLEDFATTCSVNEQRPSMQELVDQALRTIGCKALVIWREKDDLLETLHTRPTRLTSDLDMFTNTGAAGYCASNRTPVRVDDLLDDVEVEGKIGTQISHKNFIERNGLRSAIFRPLMYGDKLLGVIAIYSNRVAAFNNLDDQILCVYADRLSSQIGEQKVAHFFAVRRHIQRVLPAINQTVQMLSRIHDARNDFINARNQLSMLNIDETTRTKLKYYADRREQAYISLNNGIGLLKKELDSIKRVSDPRLNIKRQNLTEFTRRLLKQHEQIYRDAHNIEFFYAGFGAKRLARFDEELTRLVVINILTNAKDFLAGTQGQRGRMEFRVYESQDQVVLTIGDNGPGIEPENRNRVFDIFYTTKDDGYGIGLAVAQTYMLLQDGMISCDRNRSHKTGAMFRLEFSAD